MKQDKKIIIGVLALIVVVGGAWALNKETDVSPFEDSSTGGTITIGTSTPATSTTPIKGGAITVSGGTPGAAFVKLVYPIPSTERPMNFDASLSADARVILTNQVTDFRAKIAKDPADVESWVRLGLAYQIMGDYEGARIMWEYTVKIQEINFLAHYNLGQLYKDNLKDYAKSEAAFRKAITYNEVFVEPYRALHELYKYLYKQHTSNVTDILNEGVTKSNSVDLQMLLATYYKEKGNTVFAKSAFEKALVLAKETKNASAIAQIEAELKNY